LEVKALPATRRPERRNPVRVEYFVGYKETGIPSLPMEMKYETAERAQAELEQSPGSHLMDVFLIEVHRVN